MESQHKHLIEHSVEHPIEHLTDNAEIAPPIEPEPVEAGDAGETGDAGDAPESTGTQPRPRARGTTRRSPSYALDLLVIRHGPAGDRDEWANEGHDDDERPLTPRGMRQMRGAARGLRRLVKSIDHLETSPLVRAEQTAAIVGQVMGVKHHESAALGEGDRRAILRAVRRVAAQLAKRRGRKDRLTIAIVGHEPDLSTLIIWLLTGRASDTSSESWLALKKGGACLLSFDSRPQPRRAHLRWCLTRSQLERI